MNFFDIFLNVLFTYYTLICQAKQVVWGVGLSYLIPVLTVEILMIILALA